MGVFGENHLGGGILDALILEEAIANAPNGKNIGGVLDGSSSWRSYCELLARKLKEEYFLSEETYVHTPCSTIAPIYADPQHPMSLKISLSGEILEKLQVTIRVESEPGKGSEFSFVISETEKT